MVISGLQKLTLLDYPGKTACTVFLQGCNFRCPFCHNAELLGASGPEPVGEEALLAFLQKRRGILDGVCITGGEPTLQPELGALIRKIKKMGYCVKLDTNGSRPEVLEALVQERLLDYVAMDIKNSPDRYCHTGGMSPALLPQVEQSIRLLLTGELDYELRTTVVAELHDAQSIQQMGQWLETLAPEHKAKRFFLQPYVDRDSVLVSGLHAPSPEDMALFASVLRPFVLHTEIRGMG